MLDKVSREPQVVFGHIYHPNVIEGALAGGLKLKTAIFVGNQKMPKTTSDIVDGSIICKKSVDIIIHSSKLINRHGIWTHFYW